jgi:CheY-specific phosphatase CheX
MRAFPFSQCLNTVTGNTLESLALMLLVPEDEAPRSSGATVRAGVSFTGPFEGALELAISSDLLAELSENMLGLGEPIDPDLQKDALKEFANVICGNILPEIAGAQEIFLVNAPMLLSGQEGMSQDAWEVAGKTTLFTEEGTLAVTMYTDPCALSTSNAA